MSQSSILRAITVLLFCAFCIPAARAFNAYEQRGLSSLSLSQGLSDLLVNTIYSDSTGFVWFGTESSLDRFDGNHIVRFPAGTDSRRSRRVQAIAEGEGGRMYAGTKQGLFVLDKNAPALRQLFPDKIDFSVNAIKKAADGILYLGTRHGLYIYDPKTGDLRHRLLVEDNLSEENDVVGLQPGAPGVLYILTPHRLWRMVSKSGTLTPTDLPCRHHATCISEMEGVLYIGTEGDGVLAFDMDKGTFGERLMPGNGVVTSISPTGKGNLMVSTDGEGIYFYAPSSGRELHHLSTSPGSRRQLRANTVYSTHSDPRGRLWIGYYQSGVDYTPYDDEVVDLILLPDSKNNSEVSVRAMAVDHDGGKSLIGTPDGALLIDIATDKTIKYEKPALDSNLVFTATYHGGKFYIGTYHGGMYTIDPITGRLAKFGPEETHNESIFKTVFDANGNLWVGSSAGLYLFEGANPSKYRLFTSINSQLPQGNVYEIFFDSTGRGWICTENGVAVWNGTHLQTSGFPKGFINGMKIRTIYEDSAGNLYFAPDRGEVWKSDLALKNFGPLETGVGGRFAQFTSIMEDDLGYLWMGTDKGLVRRDRDGRYIIFNNVEGNANPAYTLATPLKDPEGNIWMGTTTGLHRINPANADIYTDHLNDFRLSFASLFTNSNPISDRLKEKDGRMLIELGKGENDITVNVSDFSYRYRDNLELEYRLEGIDDSWRWTDGSNPMEYRDLMPGKYLLHVREAGNPDSEIRLEIIKHGEVQWGWLILTVCILLAVTAASLIILQKRKHRAELERLARMAGTYEEIQAEPVAEQEDDASGRRPAAYRTTRLSEEECRRLFRKLEAVMKADKPYTNTGLKSKDLAEMIGATPHALSFLFNQYLHKSYYDYVNEYRVAEFKELAGSADLSRYTLTTLAERCGFSSRASFFRHFKAVTGQTPAEYLKEKQ